MIWGYPYFWKHPFAFHPTPENPEVDRWECDRRYDLGPKFLVLQVFRLESTSGWRYQIKGLGKEAMTKHWSIVLQWYHSKQAWQTCQTWSLISNLLDLHRMLLISTLILIDICWYWLYKNYICVHCYIVIHSLGLGRARSHLNKLVRISFYRQPSGLCRWLIASFTLLLGSAHIHTMKSLGRWGSASLHQRKETDVGEALPFEKCLQLSQ